MNINYHEEKENTDKISKKTCYNHTGHEKSIISLKKGGLTNKTKHKEKTGNRIQNWKETWKECEK